MLGEYLKESRIPGSDGKNAKKLSVKLWAKGVVEKTTVYEGSENTQYYIRRSGQLMYGKLDFLNCAFGIVPPELDGYESTLDAPAFDIKDIDSVFLLNRITQRSFYKKNGDIANGSRKAKRIHPDTFLAMSIIAPSMQEQIKISSFLIILENRIDAQRKLVESLKSYKRGFIFSLFKLENKYQIPMELTSMKSLLEEYRVRDTEGLRVCSVAVEKGVIDQVEHLGRSFAAADTSKYGRVEPNYVIYTKSPTGSFPYGIVKQNKLDETVAVSPLYGVYKPRTIEDGALLHYYFEQHENANNYIRPLAQKGAKNTINITTDKFLDSNIIFPKKPADVQKIVCLLDILERNILTQNTLLDKFEVERKTLLSKLFI